MGQPAGGRPGWRHGDLAMRRDETMGVAALISWFVTAFVGLYLLAVWLIIHGVLAVTTLTLVLLAMLGVGGLTAGTPSR